MEEAELGSSDKKGKRAYLIFLMTIEALAKSHPPM
jgi:hypothetical protein